MNYIEPQRRELSNSEKSLCANVVAQWAKQGRLTFRLIPNFITVFTALIICGLLIFSAINSFNSEALSLGSDILVVTWPFETPASIQLESQIKNGIRLSLVTGTSYDNTSNSIKLALEIVDSSQLAGNYEKSSQSITVPVSGKFSTAIKKGYSISPVLEMIGNLAPDPEESPSQTRIRESAQNLLCTLKTLEDNSGFIDITRLHSTDLKELLGSGFLIEKEAMVSPQEFTMPLQVPIISVPIYRRPWALVLFISAILPLVYILKELSKLGQGNEIILTPGSFHEHRTGILRTKREIIVPWDSVAISEESRSDASVIMSLLSLLFAPGPKLVIYDKSTKKEYSYRSITVRHYGELRAALISRIGITEKHEIWRYE